MSGFAICDSYSTTISSDEACFGPWCFCFVRLEGLFAAAFYQQLSMIIRLQINSASEAVGTFSLMWLKTCDES
jgi:hypothetical protein